MLATLLATLLTLQPAPADPPATIDLRVEDQPLLVLIERIARQCELGLVVHDGVVSTLLQDVTIYAKDASWSDAMDLLRREYRIELRMTDKRIEILDADAEFIRRLERRYYPITQITTGVEDFVAPRLGTGPDRYAGGGSGSILDLGDDGPVPVIEDLPELIQQSIPRARRSWDVDGVELFEMDGMLVVRQVPEIHAPIASFLADLEKNASRQVVCRLHALPSAPYRRTLPAEAYQVLVDEGMPVAAYVLSDGQRNHYHTATLRRYVMDAETVHHTVDPVSNALRTGLVLDVTPHITRDGVLANIYLATLENPDSRSTAVRTHAGAKLVEIELPTLEGEWTEDSRFVPHGGGVIYRLGDQVFGVSFEVLDR
ncbi:MAG: hypothetical protein AAF488_02255 [Planctomycetota bacterium]